MNHLILSKWGGTRNADDRTCLAGPRNDRVLQSFSFSCEANVTLKNSISGTTGKLGTLKDFDKSYTLYSFLVLMEF